MTNPEPKPTYVPRVGDIVRVTRPPMDKEEWECFMDENWTYYHCDKGIVVETTPHCEMFGKVSVVRADRSGPDDMPHGVEACRLALVEAGRGPQVSLPSQPDDCGHHSETGLGGCGRFAWHCDGCGRIRWIYDASKGIGSRADVPRGVVLEGPPTTAVEIARRMLTLGDVALLLERAGSSDDEQGEAKRALLRLEALRNALVSEATPKTERSGE